MASESPVLLFMPLVVKGKNLQGTIRGHRQAVFERNSSSEDVISFSLLAHQPRFPSVIIKIAEYHDVAEPGVITKYET
jgi:hypothetical protein